MKNYKIIFLTVLIALGSYAAEASSRKGLPAEMTISADELQKKQLKNIVLFDARSEKSYQESHIQGALLPLTSEYYQQENLFKKGLSSHSPDEDKALRENMKKYSKNTPIVTYCSSGGCQASAVLALQIKRLGFKDVRAMEDGIQTWTKKGYPIQTGSEK